MNTRNKDINVKYLPTNKKGVVIAKQINLFNEDFFIIKSGKQTFYAKKSQLKLLN